MVQEMTQNDVTHRRADMCTWRQENDKKLTDLS